MTLLEVLNNTGGRAFVLDVMREYMEKKEGMGLLSQNRPFMVVVFDVLYDAGVLTEELLQKNWPYYGPGSKEEDRVCHPSSRLGR